MSDGVIDSCCLINLRAVGDLTDVLPHLGLSWHVPPAVETEALFLRTIAADGSRGREPIDLQPSISAGILRLCRLQPGTETELYVELAAELHDGEAMSLAIASCRNWLLATDDKLAIRRAGDLGVPLVGTPELIHRWADASGPTPHELALALQRVQTRARFMPSRRSPLHGWWTRSASHGT